MIRQFVSAALHVAAERTAPPPKPWPFGLGVLSLAAFVLYALDTRKAIDSWIARVLAGEERLDAIDEALLMPAAGERFDAFQRRAPRSRAASRAWWKERVADDAAWIASVGTWLQPTVIVDDLHDEEKERRERAWDDAYAGRAERADVEPDPYGIGKALSRVRAELAVGRREIGPFGVNEKRDPGATLAVVEILRAEGWTVEAKDDDSPLTFSRAYSAADEADALRYSPAPERVPPPGWEIRPQRKAIAPARHGQIRRSLTSCASPRVVRVVEHLGPGEVDRFGVHVARGEGLLDGGLYSAADIARNWPIVVDRASLTPAERVRCGLAESDDDCPSGSCRAADAERA